MSFRSRNTFYIGFATLLIIIVIMFGEKKPQDILSIESLPKEQWSNLPYAVITQGQSTYYDEKGNRSYQFNSERIEHYREDFKLAQQTDHMIIKNPSLTLESEKTPWHIQAAQGTIKDLERKLILSDDVRIWQNNTPQGKVELTTDYLEYNPKEKKINTSNKVFIESESGFLAATGMTITTDDNTVKLHKDVKGYHKPTWQPVKKP